MRQLLRKFVEIHNNNADTSTCELKNDTVYITDPSWIGTYTAKGMLGKVVGDYVEVESNQLPRDCNRIIVFDESQQKYVSGDLPIFAWLLEEKGRVSISSWRTRCGGKYVVLKSYNNV